MHEENTLMEDLQSDTLSHTEEAESQLQETETDIVSPELSDEEAAQDMESLQDELLPENAVQDEGSLQGEPLPENVTQEETNLQDVPQLENGVTDAPIESAGVSSEEPSAPTEFKAVPYHERYYLKYREGKRNTALDLTGTRAFLEALGFDGGELRQAREGKHCSESYRNTGKNNQMYCSYCGAEISGVEFFRVPDGRLRCTTCSNSVVKTKAEVEELCQRVLVNMDNFFGASIDVPISIEVVDERKLKRKVGVPLGTKDSQSMLILGVAINKKKKYSIILENGAPRISLIATFAHELTHIWQYTHWDNVKGFKKCPDSKRLLIYEGMAKWAEIQYLYLVGETNVAMREEHNTRNRQDEYGVGFCLYEDRYPLSREAMMCEDTPFVPDRYPFDERM